MVGVGRDCTDTALPPPPLALLQMAPSMLRYTLGLQGVKCQHISVSWLKEFLFYSSVLVN